MFTVFKIAILLLSFVVGYVLGRINLLSKVLLPKEETKNKTSGSSYSSWSLSNNYKHKQTNKMPVPKIEIDESKFVTTVDTTSYKSKHTGLGDKTITEDKVSSSVSKLKKLKGE